MAQLRASRRIDWGLFLLVVAASQGYFGLMPAEVGTSQIAVLVAAVLAILAIRELGRGYSTVRLSPLALCLVLFTVTWAFAAKLLTQTSGYTFLVLSTMVVYFFLRQCTTERTLQTFALATTVALVPSILGFFVPLGIPVRLHAGSQNGYAGYFPFNSWLAICAAAAIISIVTLFASAGFRRWHVPAAGIALFALVLSKSATGSVGCIVALGALAMITVTRRIRAKNRTLLIVGGLGIGVLLLLFVLVYSVSEFIGGATGRDTTFTNRTLVWKYALEGVSESPYWGNSLHLSTFTPIEGAGSQNGFMEFALIGGVPAVLALIAIVILAGYKLIVTSDLLLPFGVFGVVVNLSVSHLTSPYIASLALFSAIAAGVRISGGLTLETATNRKGSYLHECYSSQSGV
ncbi:MAG: O-antigen ligase family protein [Mycolicibacterium sp.]|uniref:O-antigen ligase family protein n=1 Tax=Mycolicibacterium sp. TaxID=2320850 RepID=UPI003D105BDC